MSTSLMLVTALNPKIGYDNASKVKYSSMRGSLALYARSLQQLSFEAGKL